MNRNTTIYFLLFTLLCLNSLNAQMTSIPDQNFEQYLIDTGIDSDATINGQVLTSDISGVFTLDIKNYNISDFEGLQFFTSLTEFRLTSDFASTITNINFEQNTQLEIISILEAPNLSEINILQNINLTSLLVGTLGSSLSSIDVSNNINLTFLSLGHNALTDLNLENNLELTFLGLDNNFITFLDVSKNKKLTNIQYRDGALEHVNLKNGFNDILSIVILTGNPNLSCIQVDNVVNAAAAGWSKDDTATYVDDAGSPPTAGEDGSFLTCGGGSIDDLFFELGGNPDEGGTWSPQQFDGEGEYTYTVSKACYPNSTATITVELIPDPDAGPDAGSDDPLFGEVGSLNLNDLRSGSSKFFSKSILVDSGKWFSDDIEISEDGEVDFPNTGAGAAVAYSFTFEVENECGVVDIAEIVVEVNGFDISEEVEISICENEEVTTNILNDALIDTNFSGTWEDENGDKIFGPLGTYFYVGDNGSVTTVIVGKIPDPNAGSGDELFSVSGAQNLNTLRDDNSNIIADQGKWTSLEISVTEDGEVDFQNVEDEYTFTYTTNANECDVISSVDVIVKISAVLSVDNFLLNEIVIFPNPAKEILYIKGDLSRLKNIEIYSITGQHIMTVNKNLKELNLSTLEPALYFMRLNTENATKNIKIIKN